MPLTSFDLPKASEARGCFGLKLIQIAIAFKLKRKNLKPRNVQMCSCSAQFEQYLREIDKTANIRTRAMPARNCQY
jgi:hypothetical protein